MCDLLRNGTLFICLYMWVVFLHILLQSKSKIVENSVLFMLIN